MLSEVQFYVSQMDDACKVDNRDWYITIFNCDNTVLEFANQQFLVVHAPNGHVSINLPPGKYYAVGVWSYWMGPDGNYFGNHFTDKAIFQVCCGEHKCVWLYNPSVHQCGIIYDQAVKDFRKNIDQTEQDLINAGVPPEDPRYVAINDARLVIDDNMEALMAVNETLRNFAEVFGFEIQPGTGINQIELLNETNAEKMNELWQRNSEKIPEHVRIIGELNADIIK